MTLTGPASQQAGGGIRAFGSAADAPALPGASVSRLAAIRGRSARKAARWALPQPARGWRAIPLTAAGWVERAFSHVATLPAKEEKARAPRKRA